MRATIRRITDPRPPTPRSGTNPPDRVTAMGAERSLFRVHPRRQRRGSGHQWAGRSPAAPRHSLTPGFAARPGPTPFGITEGGTRTLLWGADAAQGVCSTPFGITEGGTGVSFGGNFP